MESSAEIIRQYAQHLLQATEQIAGARSFKFLSYVISYFFIIIHVYRKDSKSSSFNTNMPKVDSIN